MFLACRCNDSLSCVSLAEGFESISAKFTFLIVVLFSTSGPSSEYEEFYFYFYFFLLICERSGKRDMGHILSTYPVSVLYFFCWQTTKNKK